MIQSMTGFGGARGERDGLAVQVEVRSVNNRFFDFQPKLPREIAFLEAEIMERVRAALGRGRVSVQFALERAAPALRPRVDGEVLRAYLEALDRLAAEGSLDERGSAAQLLALPELIRLEEAPLDQAPLRALVLETLDAALADILAMKRREGRALADDLLACVQRIETGLARIAEEAPRVRETLHENLKARIAELLAETPVDPQRLAMEAAVLADRADVTEEMVRLRSHLGQFKVALDEGGSVSKKLGFLLQEFLREANTIGSKTQGLAIVQEVLLIKEEIEKLREQIQNLE